MELKDFKIQLFKQDEEPQFSIEDYEDQKSNAKNDAIQINSPTKKKSQFQSSKLSQMSNASKNQASNIQYSSPDKGSLIELKRKQPHYQSISPEKLPYKNGFVIKRPTWSATKNKLGNQICREQIPFQRTSYSPSLVPERKSAYWQSWLLPMNSTMRELSSQNPPKISASSYCVMMSDNHEILACKNLTVQKQIASLTKIMTAYTALNICSTFGIKIRQNYVIINKFAAFMNGTSAGLKIDEEILIIDLLYALLLPSGNDAGFAIAQYFGKFLSYKFAQDMTSNDKEKTSMDRFRSFKDYYDTEYQKDSLKLFVFEMNKNCHNIGLKNTHFNNATGLSDKNNYSTARDMAYLTSHCLKNHTLRLMFKKKFHTCEVRNSKLCQTRKIQWKNTNRHLFQFRQCIGVKTGITPNAGPCLSSAYKVMGREVSIIVLQCQSIESRYKDSQALFKWCRKKIRAF